MAICLLIIVTTHSYSQVTKGYWLMGGNGNAGTFNETNTDGNKRKGTFLNLNPNIGYFFVDNLAVGLSGQIITKTNILPAYGVGPFVKYYFLKEDKAINVFSELSYYSFFYENYKLSTLNIQAGTAFFLNNSVALEVSLNYNNSIDKFDNKESQINLGVGFQIHLEKK
jgi:hypothetical protein